MRMYHFDRLKMYHFDRLKMYHFDGLKMYPNVEGCSAQYQWV